MATLILTEKPSVATDFAKALEIKGKGNGFIEGNGYIITWAVGHLVELFEPEDYDDKWKRWDLGALPILPDALRYKPIAKTEKQLGIVQRQLQRTEVERIIIATDAGREGEVIARTILQTISEPKGALFRFWTSQALTPQVVQDTLKQLKPASAYERLWNAGQSRQIADWLVGMNLSRAATLKMRGGSREVFSVGRVQTAVLALIVDRKREREQFTPEPYWVCRAQFDNPKGQWWGTWFKGEQTRFLDREAAERLLASIQGKSGQVKSVKRTHKKQAPPQLYSLTDLQRDANSKFGLSAKQTLDTAQSLYEDRKCLSYPRTDSRVLGSQNLDMVKRLVAKLGKAYPDLFQGIEPKRLSLSHKLVFNDAKLTDHHALIPLAPLPESAPQNEQRIFDLVLRRFAAVFHPDYEYEATEIITEVEKATFRTKGSRPLVPGWKAVYGTQAKANGPEDEAEEENLPLLEKGDSAQVVDTRLEDKLTQPPPEYTEALLLKDMTNPSRYVSEEELQKIFKGDVGLGTQATRAQIIETLLNRKYVAREKKKLLAMEKGCLLIDTLRRFARAKAIATPEETARWEMELERIAQGSGDPRAFIEGIRTFVREGVEEIKSGSVSSGMQLGQCPACGGAVVEGSKGYGCANWRERDGGCRFTIWKEIAGQTISPETARQLLSGEPTPVMAFRSKEGKAFSAALKLERQQPAGTWATRFVAAARPASTPATFGTCPRCGGAIIEGKRGYGCANWREQDGGCRFVIWKEIGGRKLTLGELQDLLAKGETDRIEGFVSEAGEPFSARLKLDGTEVTLVEKR